MKPRARSVYFSIFMSHSLSLPLRPREARVEASSLGFRPVTLTFLNAPSGCVAGFNPRLEADVGRGIWKRKGPLHEFVRGGAFARNRLRNRDVLQLGLHRRYLPLSGQGPVSRTPATGRPRRRPDPSRRPPLRHRKRSQRLRSRRPGVAAEEPLPDADAQRAPG